MLGPLTFTSARLKRAETPPHLAPASWVLAPHFCFRCTLESMRF